MMFLLSSQILQVSCLFCSGFALLLNALARFHEEAQERRRKIREEFSPTPESAERACEDAALDEFESAL